MSAACLLHERCMFAPLPCCGRSMAVTMTIPYHSMTSPGRHQTPRDGREGLRQAGGHPWRGSRRLHGVKGAHAARTARDRACNQPCARDAARAAAVRVVRGGPRRHHRARMYLQRRDDRHAVRPHLRHTHPPNRVLRSPSHPTRGRCNIMFGAGINGRVLSNLLTRCPRLRVVASIVRETRGYGC